MALAQSTYIPSGPAYGPTTMCSPQYSISMSGWWHSSHVLMLRSYSRRRGGAFALPLPLHRAQTGASPGVGIAARASPAQLLGLNSIYSGLLHSLNVI